jgi:FtsH-binding integral membrane protein
VLDSLNGLPLHPLATHAAVVLVPLAGLLGVLFAVPRTRGWATVPLPVLALAAAIATWVSVRSGEALQRVGGLGATGLGGDVGRLVDEHAERADLLLVLVWAYAAVAGLALASQRTSVRLHPWVAAALSAVLVVGAVALSVQTVRVGELGARAVWNPAGGIDYSAER